MRFLFIFLVLLIPALGQPAIPFGFEPNLGQFPSAVRFLRRSSGNLIYITRDAIVLRNGVRIQIADVDPNVVPEGASPSSTVYHFYQGNDASAWRTNVRLFDSVRLGNIYPGVSALFTTSTLMPGGSLSIGLVNIVLTVQPGADPGRFRLNVLNTGAMPMDGPGGIWFSGGRIPGVFQVRVQSTQIDGERRVPIPSALKIESAETLSVDAPGRNPALATEIEIAFPSYDLFNGGFIPPRSTDGNRYLTANVDRPIDFGDDGMAGPSNCVFCADAAVARMDDSGKPIWVSLFGGEGSEYASLMTPSRNGVALSGTTDSDDFPLTLNAPHSRLDSERDLFLAFFNRDSGQLINATYAGLEGAAWLHRAAVHRGGDFALGGGYSIDPSSSQAESLGYLLRWVPSENRFVCSLRFDAPLISAAADDSGNTYFALSKPLAGDAFRAGIVDPIGRQQGVIATVDVPDGSPDTQLYEIRLFPRAGGEFWAVYQFRRMHPSESRERLWIAKISPAQGQVLLNRPIASTGSLVDLGFTPAGNLKLLVQGSGWTEETTDDAPLMAACPDTAYFLVLSPSGQTRYATYVVSTGFDFANENEPKSAVPARVGCFASTAGRFPAVGAAAGQLITITGGGFGPATPIYYAPDANGRYPLTAGGFRVRISGRDAPIIAIARGLIAVQVPYEIGASFEAGTIEVFENGTALNAIPIRHVSHVFGLFDTGDRNNSANLPSLAALNEDGTVNSRSNPARAGSVVSLFGSGAGLLSPALETGGLNPIPPAGPLSESPLYRACRGCEVLYLGSAPGLSTSVVQVNVRIVATEPGSGVRPHGIGIGLATSPRGLLAPSPAGILFIE